MDLSAFPTDSLYKFIALAGLAVILFSAYFPYSQLLKARRHIEKLELEEVTIKVDVEELDQLAGRLERLTGPEEKEVDAVRRRMWDIRRRIEAHKVKTAIAKQLNADVKLFYRIMILGFILGTVLECGGFSLWYFKLQRHLDRAVQVQPQVPR